MQLVVGDTDGSTYSIELDESGATRLNGKRIGDTFDADFAGLDGYTLEITGGSDEDGFPMKQQVKGSARKRLLVKGGIGVSGLKDGERKRISLHGNSIADDIVQVNCRVEESGSSSIEELLNSDDEDGE